MNPTFRPLLIGGALLFGGCGTDNPTNPELGQPCAREGEASCNADLQPLMECRSAVWSELRTGFCRTCETHADGFLMTVCAAAGFIGLDVAGQKHLPMQLLRNT